MDAIVEMMLLNIRTKKDLLNMVDNSLQRLQDELKVMEGKGVEPYKLSAFEEIISALESIKYWAEGHSVERLKTYYKEALKGYMSFSW